MPIPDRDRPLAGLVWYPAQDGGTPTKFGETKLFVGALAAVDAKPAPGRFPLVVLSHGWGGHRLNQGWRAAHLAARGMVVVAVNHPGSTTGDIQPQRAMAIWTRTEDVGHILSFLLADPGFGPRIDPGRIALIGHSLGGLPALASAGVRVERNRMIAWCAEHDDEGCPGIREAGLDQMSREKFDAPHGDRRVDAVVALASGLSPAMTYDSLTALRVPALVIFGDRDESIPAAHIRAMLAMMPGAGSVELSEAAHFDLLPACQPGGAALLRASGDTEPVCDDVVDRTLLHTRMTEAIDEFFGDLGWIAASIGVRHLAVTLPERGTDMDVTVWYPSDGPGQSVVVGDGNPLFQGSAALADAPMAPGRRPLIVLSQGGLRSGFNVGAWMASRLAARGFVVAMLRQPNPTYLTEAQTLPEIWLRPADVSATLTAVLSEAALASRIDAQQIGVLGLQIGGTAALELAGGELDRTSVQRFVDSGGVGVDCARFRKASLDLHAVNLPELGGSLADRRVRGIVLIDPEFSRNFTPASVAGLPVPVRVINLGTPATMWPGLNAEGLAHVIPGAQYFLVPDATQYSAFPECKPEASGQLKEDGEEALCDDPPERRS